MPFRAVLFTMDVRPFLLVAACGLVDFALVAPWCSFTVSLMHLL